MELLSVSNPRWTDPEHSMMDVIATFDTTGPVPFTANPTEGEFGPLIYANAVAGDYGPIADFVAPPEPTPEENRELMPELERWRVNTVIDLEPGLRDKINSAIDAMPEPQRTISKNKLADVQMFRRMDPLFDLIGGDPSIGKTPEDIDEMWEAAGSLS